ncbi:MAG TPA: secretion protein HlyD, partial [Kiritimatiellia bacterium]|nr:secretion protein HlyD [Kiritimatiellia bacterium]
ALGALAVGQALAVRCDGCAEDIPAKITYVSPEAEFTPPIIYSNETRSKLVFMVEAKTLDCANLHPGQPLEVALR